MMFATLNACLLPVLLTNRLQLIYIYRHSNTDFTLIQSQNTTKIEYIYAYKKEMVYGFHLLFLILTVARPKKLNFESTWQLTKNH